MATPTQPQIISAQAQIIQNAEQLIALAGTLNTLLTSGGNVQIRQPGQAGPVTVALTAAQIVAGLSPSSPLPAALSALITAVAGGI